LVAWSRISEIAEIILRESPPLNTPLRVFLPKSEGRQFEVRTRDGRKLWFIANNVRGVDVFGALLRHAALDLEVPVSVKRAEV
jgi:hypothetical protein